MNNVISADSHNSDYVRRWRRTAMSRLRIELAGIAFARKHGLSPEDWAEHLWSQGAREWMGQDVPTVAEYLCKEAEAIGTLYPAVRFEPLEGPGETAGIVFLPGSCLGGWGRDQWGLARSLGLGKGHVCRYCREAFRLWNSQLGLAGIPEPQRDGSCRYVVRKRQAGDDSP